MIEVRDRVRFVETDMMGVVHHSNYLRWFEKKESVAEPTIEKDIVVV